MKVSLKNHEDRVKKVADLLANAESKKTYLAAVRFRQTKKAKHHPLGRVPTTIKSIEYNKFLQGISEHYRQFNHEKEWLSLGKDEIFIDCGAYTGDTIDRFIRDYSEFNKIIAFEPDINNFLKLQENYGNHAKITLINAGAYDHDGKIAMVEAGDMTSHIAEEHEVSNKTIEVKAIDNLPLDKVTYIKMDIEGAELKALMGAKQTILRDKPKLNICLYHKNDDMISIIEYIHEIAPDYILYVGQNNPVETTLFAIPGKDKT
jgi:FkbM family methyltransferase